MEGPIKKGKKINYKLGEKIFASYLANEKLMLRLHE